MAERPSVYFHFEMGVSWPARQPGAPKTHQLTYMSRSARERANQFPRQLPPSNTNYLTGPSTQDSGHHVYPLYEHQQYPAVQHDTSIPLPSGNLYQQPLEQQQPPQPSNQFQASEDHQRSSRSQSRSSHERGRSAPPPLSGSPWDADPEPMMATALPKRTSRPQLWKALPPTPGQFRLGHDDMPWSPSPFPMEHVGGGDNDTSTWSSAGAPHPAAQQGQQRVVDDRDRARTKDMQSLATAMMTVDNGFEDQWWYQGPRLVNIAGDLVTPATMAERYAPEGRVSWPVANVDTPGRVPRDCYSTESPRPSMVDIVSPVSDFSSPASAHRHPLRRSLTTRSDELFI